MYLKRIEMQGFKSFADKTVIDVGQGITGIVGPNGSGKSNISDAIRWVMGEQSARTLRGGKMEDVIFNGTQKRRQLGYAEVSMVFDNSSGFLPSQYSEVEVTRRVFRSGESDYMINRNPCRLKDIHELFMDTGMGRDGYSIVGQGKIAEIVSQKGDERRSVFEEAAGISKYRYRKQEAERKLSHTEDNLVRVRDILAELEGRVEPLHRQSEKAMKYLDLREELKGIEVSALLEIIDTKKTQLAQAEENYIAAAARLEETKAAHAAASEQSENLFAQMKDKDAELEAARQELAQAQSAGAALENRRVIIENNIENTRENILRLKLELENRGKHEETLRTGIAAEEDHRSALLNGREKLNSQLEEAESRLREATREMASRNNALEEARAQVAELGQKKAEAKTRIEGLEALKRTYETRGSAIDEEIASAKNDRERYEADAKALGERQEAAVNERDTASRKLRDALENIAELESRAQNEKNEYNSIVGQLSEKRARHNMLKDMENSLEGYARSVRQLVSDSRSKRYRGAMVGVLSKLIKTDKRYITAVEVALGGAMQNIVVKNEDDAKEAIEYLKQNRLGRVTFLPVSTQEGRRLDGENRILASPGAVAIASDVVIRDSSIDNVVESLLGRTLIVDNMDNAARIARENRYRFKIVTLSGELLQPGGSITGGSVNKSQALLRRGDEIASLAEECTKLDKMAENAENTVDELLERLDCARKTGESLRQEQGEAEARLSRLKAEAEMKRSLLSVTEERVTRLEEEKAELAVKSLAAEDDKSELNGLLYGAGGLIAGAEKLVTAKQEALRTATEKRERAAANVTDKRMELAAADKDIQISVSRIDDLKTRLAGSAADCETGAAAVVELEAKIRDMETELAASKTEAARQDETINSLKADIDRRNSEKGGANSRLEKVREELKSLSDAVFTSQEEVVRLETARSRLESEHENAANRLWDDYELTYNAALPLKKELGSLRAAQKQVSELKGKIKALGNINIDAIEEYKEVKQRYEFMNSQVSDLEEGKRNLEKLINEMMVVMQTQFTEKFRMINENFGKIFADLFGGGHAAVRLADPNNVLESGIEIEVQPPGKKLQNISLLSGGEHALTAIALLFALLKATPTPFIVLDEIEAALDDENVYRFADYIRNYDDTTQFVIITHRRGTMEAADILYGVTMQEKGVSTLLSMKLDDIRNEDM